MPRKPHQHSDVRTSEQGADLNQISDDVRALKRCYYCKRLLPPWDRKGSLRCWDKETDTEYMAGMCDDCGISAFYGD